MKKLNIIFFILVLISTSYLSAQGLVEVKMKSMYDVIANDTIAVEIDMKSALALGGIDIQFQYPDTLLTYLYAEQREGLNNWEFFAIGFDSIFNIVKIISIADQPGPGHPNPEDFYPDGVIANIYFETSSGFAGDSLIVPLNFFWLQCTNNSISNTFGDSLLLNGRIYDYESTLIWDEDDDILFPEPSRPLFTGTPDGCITGDPLPRVIDFYQGILTNYPLLCGDADGTGSVDISDAVFLIAYIFGSGPAPDPLTAGDVDCSGGVDVSDSVYLIAFIFAGGPAPCAGCP